MSFYVGDGAAALATGLSALHKPDTPTATITDKGVSGQLTITLSAFSDDDPGDAWEATQYRVSPAGENDWTESGELTGVGDEEGPIDITGLDDGVEYDIQVRHKDNSGDAGSEFSEWSASVTAWTP